jgi:hypothetical protein
MKKKHGWLLYTLLWLEQPAQKKFLEYSPKTKLNQNGYDYSTPWIRWEELTQASYALSLDENTATLLHRLWRWCRWIPFIENVFLAWSPTFGMYDDFYDIVVVTNVRRVWLSKVLIQLFILLITLTSKEKEWTSLRLALVVDRLHIDLQWIRRGVGDLMSVYWLAHLVPVYLQHENTQWMLFDANKRITYLLPYHPLCPVINLGMPVYEWTTKIRQGIEKILSTIVWDSLDWIMYISHSFRKHLDFRYDKTAWISPWVWWDKNLSRTLTIQWKMMLKSDENKNVW